MLPLIVLQLNHFSIFLSPSPFDSFSIPLSPLFCLWIIPRPFSLPDPFSSFLPDHNKTHAADVLHATSYLLFEQIPEFSYSYSDKGGRTLRGGRRNRSNGGTIASAFSVLELFACYMAAAMHDFDHPGRTNAFLVSTGSPLVSCLQFLASC